MADVDPARARVYVRDSRLRSLGFASYREYIASSLWAAARRAYRRSNRPQECLLCGVDKVVLHHRTYDHLGTPAELDDLIPLCLTCHQDVHELERRGVIETGSDLTDLASATRAALYERPALDGDAGPRPVRPWEVAARDAGWLADRIRRRREMYERFARRKAERPETYRQALRRQRVQEAEDTRNGVGVPLDQRTYDP